MPAIGIPGFVPWQNKMPNYFFATISLKVQWFGSVVATVCHMCWDCSHIYWLPFTPEAAWPSHIRMHQTFLCSSQTTSSLDRMLDNVMLNGSASGGSAHG